MALLLSFCYDFLVALLHFHKIVSLNLITSDFLCRSKRRFRKLLKEDDDDDEIAVRGEIHRIKRLFAKIV